VLRVFRRPKPLIDRRGDIHSIGPTSGGYIRVHVFIEMEPPRVAVVCSMCLS